MRNLFAKLWEDDDGVVTLEYLVLATILGLGVIVGVTAVTAALNVELSELAGAISGLNQDYTSAGFTSRMNAGSIAIPKPGPDGTRTTPFSHFNDKVALVAGMSDSPLYSVKGTGFGMHAAKMAASRYPSPEPDMCGVQSRPAACAIRATRIDRMNPP